MWAYSDHQNKLTPTSKSTPFTILGYVITTKCHFLSKPKERNANDPSQLCLIDIVQHTTSNKLLALQDQRDGSNALTTTQKSDYSLKKSTASPDDEAHPDAACPAH